MYILDYLDSKWESREYKIDYMTRRRQMPNESINTWEKRFVDYWGKVPDYAKKYMREHPDTLLAVDVELGSLENPMYFLFGSTEFSYMDVEECNRRSYYDKSKPRKYKEISLSRSTARDLLKNIQIEETTDFLRYLGLKKVMIDIVLCGTIRNLQDILKRYTQYGWKLGEATTIDGSSHVFLSLYLNPYN